MIVEMLREVYEGKNCVVTGGAGFIGKALVNSLQLSGANVYVLDTKINDHDIRNLDCIKGCFHNVDCVFHLAAKTEVGESKHQPHLYYNTNVQGTVNVLTAAYTNNVKSIVIASTDKVYGKQRIPFKEGAELLQSDDPYSNSKRIADMIVQDYRHMYGLPIITLRSCNTYGQGQSNATTLIVRTVTNLLKGNAPIVHTGMQTAIREWMHVNDAVKAYLFAGACNLQNIKTYPIWNVGSNECYTVQEIIDTIKNVLNIYIPNIMINDGVERVGNQSVSCTLLKNILKTEFNYTWNPVRLEDGIKRTIDYLRGL